MDPLPQTEQLRAEPPRAVLITLQPELRASVVQGLAERAQVIDCSSSGRYPSCDAVLNHKPTMCFIDVGSNDEALALVTEVAAADVPVAALHLNNQSDLILRSFRCGASEFLFAPIERADLLEAFDRLLKKSGPHPVP